MRTLTIADNWKDWKFGDTDAVMTFTALDDDKVPDFSDRTLTFKIASTLNNDLEHPKDFAATATGYIQDKNVILKTEDVKQLTPGNYIVELWAMSNDTQKDAVYPSKGFAQFTIEENSMKVSDVTNIPSMTINAFWNAVMQKVGTLTKGAKGDPGKTPKIVIGSVTKLSPDAQPSATLVPLQSDPNTYTLNLQIPQGVQGEQGLQGIPGVGSKGLDGNNGLTPTIDPKTKHWMIGGTDTGVIAEGQAGKDADPSKYVTIVSFNQLRQQVQDNATALEQKIKQGIQKAIDEQNTKLNSLESKVNLNALLLSGYNVRDFGAIGDGENDDTDAIQKAIKQVALDWKKDNFKTNLVVMPAGRYKVTSTIILPPYVKLISAGLVTIESYITDGAAIQIKWLGDDDPDITGKGLGNAYQSQDWQRGYIIEGSRGGFSFVSKVKNDNNIGIEVGFRSAEDRGASNLKNVARSGLNNISIGNYGVGVRLNGIDFYIFNFTNMHIEDNKINVQNNWAGGNYGENIYFDRCVIATADVGIDQISGGFDLTFNECSIGNNKLAISNSDHSNNNITIIGGNLEGNTIIYDGSKGSVQWMTSLNIISSNIFIRPDNASNITMFKGPLILNLDNPYIVSTLELVHQEYLCDSQVFVTYNRNPVFARTSSQPIFITERDNVLLNGDSMSKLAFSVDNGYGKLVTKDNGLYRELQAAGFDSALQYEKSDKDDKNWEFFRPTQKINVLNKSTFFLRFFGEAHLQAGNINFVISFYDNENKLMANKQFYANAPSDVEKVLYGHTPAQIIPVGAVSAAIAVSASCTANGAGFQFAYIGLEVE